MECPYRFTKESAECIKEECLSYMIQHRPTMVDTKLEHIPTPYCKILDAKIE